MNTSGCVSFRSSRPQVISLSAIQKWKLWSLDMKNASLRADGFGRDVFLHAPLERGPSCQERVWALAYGVSDGRRRFAAH